MRKQYTAAIIQLGDAINSRPFANRLFGVQMNKMGEYGLEEGLRFKRSTSCD
jgi:hypothetical protein